MIRMNFALAVLAFASSFSNTPTAMAWHLASKRACLTNASAPHCGPDARAMCKARRQCTVEPGKTISACAEWRCERRLH
jgi:hypothetical protein